MADLTVRAGVTMQTPRLYVHCCTCFQTSPKFVALLCCSLNKHGQNFHAKRGRIRYWLRAANTHSHRKHRKMTRYSQKKLLLNETTKYSIRVCTWPYTVKKDVRWKAHFYPSLTCLQQRASCSAVCKFYSVSQQLTRAAEQMWKGNALMRT